MISNVWKIAIISMIVFMTVATISGMWNYQNSVVQRLRDGDISVTPPTNNTNINVSARINALSDETAGGEDRDEDEYEYTKAGSIEEVSDGLVEDEDDDSTSNHDAGVTTDNDMTSIISSEYEATTAITDNNKNEKKEDSSIVKPSIPIAEASDVYIFPDRTKMNEIETYEELTNQANLHNNLPLPRDLHVLFVGDSLTRYQYLDLAYFLKHGSWADPADEPNFLIEKHHETWNDFYSFTNEGLKPYEECDCFRQEGRVKMYKNANLIENRYFQDLERNNTATYLQKFGDDFWKSHWNVSDIHKPHSLLTDWSEYKPVYWLKWVEMIEDFVCKMEPKPSIFIFNAGLWDNNNLVNVTLQGEIVEALKKCEILSMFKTTTKISYKKDRLMAEYEEQLCNQTDYCLDLTWTGMVPRELYVDPGHFMPPVYSYMNLELLSILSSMSNEKQDDNTFSETE